MTLFRWMFYSLRLVWFLFNTLLYRVYLFVNLLSKPRASTVIAFLCYGVVVYIHYRVEGMPVFDWAGSPLDWAQTWLHYFQYDHAIRGWLAYIDLPLLCLAITCQLIPWYIYRRFVSVFPAMHKPLMPLKKVRAPKTKIPTAKARLAVKPLRHRGGNGYRDPASLPPSVAALLTASEPRRALAAPPIHARASRPQAVALEN